MPYYARIITNDNTFVTKVTGFLLHHRTLYYLFYRIAIILFLADFLQVMCAGDMIAKKETAPIGSNLCPFSEI